MNFENKSFAVMMSGANFSEQWERTFGKKLEGVDMTWNEFISLPDYSAEVPHDLPVGTKFRVVREAHWHLGEVVVGPVGGSTSHLLKRISEVKP